MTARPFDAPASTTRPTASARAHGRSSTVRVAWLLGRFVRREPVRYELYEERFARSASSFRCDIAALRGAGIYRGAELLGNTIP
jgi:hypothetical protein